ncbi:uncharacterized protein C2845_PM18G09640 [Panicum miliaceum]|uniref:Uncharacterized protein n=1 Tax=Panicum miliaceum TaxID=4540 RepID=A0A3L6PGC0_PANMI|nr:uncharacterized protein C2845_PM18G09640 [Panicum miliaceum]
MAPHLNASAATNDEEDLGAFSQPWYPRSQMENLDLNSMGDGYPHIGSYSGLLQSDGVPGVGGRPSIAPGGGGGRSARALFQPPRSSGGGGRSGRGGCQAGRVGGRRPRTTNNGARGGRLPQGSAPYFTPLGVSGGGRGRLAALRGCGSTSAANNFVPAEEYGEHSVDEENHSINWSTGESGLGRRDNGCIVADDAWWVTNTQSECKKFRWAMPTYLDHLAEMFHGTTIDGRSSCILGESEDPTDTNLDDDDDDEDTFKSPMSTGSKKRGSSTTDTISSPAKKHKSPMVKCMKGLIDTIQSGSSKDADVAIQIQEKMASRKKEEKKLEQQEEEQEIEACLQLVKECGAADESEEYYVATMLFGKRYN